MSEQTSTPGRKAVQTFLAIMGLFLVYALAVQVTDISVQRVKDPDRQELVVGVLRFLADPNLTDPDTVDRYLGDESGPTTLTDTTNNTLRLIVETIFMALMATTIGTLLAVPVSFLAARNLMMELTSPLAAIMLGIVALPIGGWLGGQAVSLLLGLADTLSGGPATSVGALVAILAILFALSKWGPPLVSSETRSLEQTVLAAGRGVLLLMLGLLALGMLAGLGTTAGVWLEDNLGFLGFLGNFLQVLSDLIQLMLAPFVAFIAALAAVSWGSRYGQEAVLRMTGVPARALTAVVTAMGTAVLVYGLGSGLNWLYQFDNPDNWTTWPALIGGGVLGLGSLLLAPKRPFAVGAFIYSLSRSVLNALRSIEPLIMGVIFVVWVGLGPFAGVMALTLHTIAALGKLFSEQIEGISEGPIEAINATGANRLQMVVFAVIPQIIPPYIAYTLYRWDINVRMSTIIGFVGGGGVGFLLSQTIRLLAYRDASVMMLAIAVVVASLDYISSQVRNRVI